MKSYRKPRRYKRKKSIFKSRFFWLVIFVLIILGTLFYFAVFYEKFQIKEIKISGNEKISPEEIRKIAEEQIVKKILFFSSWFGKLTTSKSIFLLKSDELAKTLLDAFPRIAEVKTGRNLPDVLIIKIKERETVGVWSKNGSAGSPQDGLTNDLGVQSQKYFLIDKEGIIFEEVAEPDGFLIIKSPEWFGRLTTNPEEPVLGKEIFAKKYIEMILEIEKQLKDKANITTKDFIVASDKITATVFEGWQIYFDPNGSAGSPQDGSAGSPQDGSAGSPQDGSAGSPQDGSAGSPQDGSAVSPQVSNISEQISNLTLTLQEKIPAEKRSELEYVDLRFGNRVYFRYRTSSP